MKTVFFWGISIFWQIWEDMCNSYIFISYKDDYHTMYADTNIKINGKNVANYTYCGYSIFKNEKFDNQFFIKFRREIRCLRPDLIYYVKQDAFFPFVEFDIINDSGNFIDFIIRPMRTSKAGGEIYSLICDYFKIKKKGFRPNSGVKQKNSTLFKKYPKEEFFLKKKQKQDSFEKLNSIKILDYKYIDYKILLNKNKKIDIDITKQLCYEYCLKNMLLYQNMPIESHFIIPLYSDIKNDIGEEERGDTMYSRLNE